MTKLLHCEAKISLRQAKVQRISVPVADSMISMHAMSASKSQFLAAIREAMKAKYQRQRDIDNFVWEIFHGEFAVSEDLDDHERWFVMDLVASQGNEVQQRFFVT